MLENVTGQDIGIGIGIVVAIFVGGVSVYDYIRKRIKTTTYVLTKNDLNYIFLEHDRYCKEISKILYVDTIEEQLNAFTRQSYRIQVESEQIFSNILLKLHAADDNICTNQHQIMNQFNNAVSATLGELFLDFKSICRSNHFIDYNDDAFREYMKMNADTFSKKFISSLKKNFITYQEYEDVEPFLEDIRIIASDALSYSLSSARKIASEKYKVIKEAKECFNDTLKRSLNFEISSEEDTSEG